MTVNKKAIRKPVRKRTPRKVSFLAKVIGVLKNFYREPKTTTLGLLYLFMLTSMLAYGKIPETVYIAVAPIALPLLFKGKSKEDES